VSRCPQLCEPLRNGFYTGGGGGGGGGGDDDDERLSRVIPNRVDRPVAPIITVGDNLCLGVPVVIG